MKSFLGGTNVSLAIEFSEGGDPIIPTPGSVTYTLLDHANQDTLGITDEAIATGAADWRVIVQIPAAKNLVDAGKRFERRTVVVKYTVDGVQLEKRVLYQVIPELNISISPKSVRSYLGVTESELADDDVDLFAAYLAVDEDVGSANLTAALISGTRDELHANTMIRMQAVLDVLPSLKNRVAQAEKNGNLSFERSTIKDFSQLEQAARDAYASARAAVATDGLSSTANTYVVLTQDSDPITG